MCLVQDDIDFEKAEEHIHVEVECRATRAYPRPRVTWSGERDVSVSPVRSHVFGDSVTYDNVTHEYSLVSSVLYTASLNDTNSSLSCNVQQEDLYTSVETVTIIVDPKPLPLIKVNNAVMWLLKDAVRNFTAQPIINFTML